jgi:hypothetical protein
MVNFGTPNISAARALRNPKENPMALKRTLAAAASPHKSGVNTGSLRTYIDSPSHSRASVFRLLAGLFSSLFFISGPAAVQAGERGAVGDLYACTVNSGANPGSILQFDGLTGEFVCIFAEHPPDLPSSLFRPYDLAWAPNGNLWVTSYGTWDDDPKCVIEYDGQTGAFLGYIVQTAGSQIPGSPAISLSLGGPNGNLYLPEDTDTFGAELYEYDRLTHQNLGVAASPSPPMVTPNHGRFTSHGTYLVLGYAAVTVPTVREYDATTFAFIRDLVVESLANRRGVLETPGGGSYLVTQGISYGDRVDEFDVATGALLGMFIPPDPCLSLPWCPCDDPDSCYFDAMQSPVDLAYGPNGHLFVSAEETPVWEYRPAGGCCDWRGAVHEFDPETGEQIRVIGKQAVGGQVNPTMFDQPAGIEFKPLPGDFGMSGAAFQGDWVVNEIDLARFVAALDGSAPAWTTAANLLSFDQERDGEVDCGDWPAFRAAFLASSGYSPEPMLDIHDFVATLLGTGDRPWCFADRNGDGAADGADIALFIERLLLEPACGSPASGDCCAANGTPFCADEACCDSVCAVDDYCCSTEWDSICADQAAADPNCPCGAVTRLAPRRGRHPAFRAGPPGRLIADR